MTDRDGYLQNLPKVDENSEIQTNSLKALDSLLPSKEFCLRDERVEDYGVDVSLEVLKDGLATNFRTQIQLKGTRSIKPETDGSYRLQIKTSNLNYLLNNPISIYVLYIERENEFRFVRAGNEFQRLAETNPKWREQKTIELHFYDILDLASLNEIREQIIKQSSFIREINETLVLAQSNVLVEINPKTFEITDKKAILNLVADYGISLINEGYSKEILEKISVLDNEDKETSSVKTVKAYAEYYSGHYHTAKEIITLLEIGEQEISEDDQQIVDWLKSACDYRLGNITSEEHTEKLRTLAEKDDTQKFSSFRFDYIHRLLLNEGKTERRKELVDELRNEVKKIPKDDLLTENILQFSYYILEAELGTIIKELTENMSNISIRKSLNVYQNIDDLSRDVADLIVDHREKATKWEDELTEIFEKTKNQILKADIIVERVLFVISKLTITNFHSAANGVAFENIGDDVFEKCKSFLENAIQIYSSLNLYERKLRAESYFAALASLKGKAIEASEMLAKISETSGKMGYAKVKANAENPLSEIFNRIIDEANSTDLDEKWANNSDDEMEDFAQDILENMGLPQSRLPNIKKDVLASRQINREHFQWCQYIELQQNLAHTKSKETSYARPIEQFGHCSFHNYDSVFGNPDYEAVILAFKRTYCETCPDRKTKGS